MPVVYEVPCSVPQAAAASLIAQAAIALGLHITLTGTLAGRDHAPHWHLKRGAEAGTLEVTFLIERSLLIISYHANRTGDGWVTAAAPQIARLLREPP